MLCVTILFRDGERVSERRAKNSVRLGKIAPPRGRDLDVLFEFIRAEIGSPSIVVVVVVVVVVTLF